MDVPAPKYLPRYDQINPMIPKNAYTEIPTDLRMDSGYQIYESPRRDSHSFLDRDLQTGLGFSQYKGILRSKLSNGPLIENLTMSEDELKQRFPDYDKASYALKQSDNPSDILQPVPYKDKGLSIQIPDSLKSIDTRPYEQKRLDDLLDTANVFIYLMRQRLLEDMANGTKIANDQKLTFYYNLFIGGLDDIKGAYQFYLSKTGSPGYTLDPKLTDKIDRYYLKEGGANLFTQITTLYDEILKREATRGSVGLNAADVTEFTGKLNALKIDTPQYLMADGEDEIKEDSFDVIRSFADDVNEFFNTLNNSLAPYYIYMFDLSIPGVPIPAEDQGAELSRSFVSDMASLQTLYSDITLAYIYKSDIFSKILNNPKNTAATATSTNKLAKYRQNILLLPNISAENVKLINQLFDENKITETQCEAFEETVNQVIMLNKYFGTLYNLYLINPDKPDYAALKAILTGASPFNLNPQQNGTIIKIADASAYFPENLQYGFQNITTSVKVPLVTPIYGFSSAAVEVKPLDKNSVKAATSSPSSIPSASEIGNAIASGATQAANTIAQGSSQAAQEVAKGATQVGNAIASGATKAANDVGKSVSKLFKKPKKPKWL